MAEKVSVQLIQTFKKDMIKQLDFFINSDYHNKSTTIIELYESIKQYLSNSDKFERFENFYYSKKNKNQLTKASFNKHLSLLYKLLNEFIFFESVKAEKTLKNLSIARYYSENEMEYFFDTSLKNIEESLNKEKLDYKTYGFRTDFEELKSINYTFKEEKRNGDGNLKNCVSKLEQEYVARKLYFILQLMQRFKVLNITGNLEDYKKFIGAIEKEPVSNDILVSLLLKVIKLLESDTFSIQNLNDLVGSLKNDFLSIRREILKEIFIFIINNSKKLFQVKIDYFHFVFDIYKFQLNNNILFNKQDKIRPAEFRNIVSLAINTKELNWLEVFLKQNEHKIISSDLSSELYNYSKARLYFLKENYVETQLLMRELHFKDSFYKIALKRLEIMLYFELEEWEFVESLINAFRVTISEKRISEINNTYNFIEENRSFINYLNNLYKLKNLPKAIKTEKGNKLVIELKPIKYCGEKSWLIKKYEEMLVKTSKLN